MAKWRHCWRCLISQLFCWCLDIKWFSFVALLRISGIVLFKTGIFVSPLYIMATVSLQIKRSGIVFPSGKMNGYFSVQSSLNICFHYISLSTFFVISAIFKRHILLYQPELLHPITTSITVETTMDSGD